MSDLTAFTAAKSDQLNADDLIKGPITINITEVRTNGGAEQPVTVFYEGGDGKPWRPCKNMIRAMVHMWGKPSPTGPKLDSQDCVGRSLTLYRDPEVKFGGLKVGGIRISHASHLNGTNEMALTVAKGRKGAFTVRPLIAPKTSSDASQRQKRPTLGEWFLKLQAELDGASTAEVVNAIRARADAMTAFEKATGDNRARLELMFQKAGERVATLTGAVSPLDAPLDEEAAF